MVKWYGLRGIWGKETLNVMWLKLFIYIYYIKINELSLVKLLVLYIECAVQSQNPMFTSCHNTCIVTWLMPTILNYVIISHWSMLCDIV